MDEWIGGSWGRKRKQLPNIQRTRARIQGVHNSRLNSRHQVVLAKDPSYSKTQPGPNCTSTDVEPVAPETQHCNWTTKSKTPDQMRSRPVTSHHPWPNPTPGTPDGAQKRATRPSEPQGAAEVWAAGARPPGTPLQTSSGAAPATPPRAAQAAAGGKVRLLIATLIFSGEAGILAVLLAIICRCRRIRRRCIGRDARPGVIQITPLQPTLRCTRPRVAGWSSHPSCARPATSLAGGGELPHPTPRTGLSAV